MILTAVLFLVTHNTSVYDINPAFHYGRTQQIFSAVVVLLCLSTSLICLVTVFWIHSKRHQKAVEALEVRFFAHSIKK